MVLTLNSPMPRLRLEQQIVGGEDYLNEVSSAAARFGEAAQEISGSGVAFSFPYFFWLSKRNRVASRARATTLTAAWVYFKT